jgi:hypothetical protein
MGLFGKLFGSKEPAPPCAIHPDDQSLVRREDQEWWNDLSLDDCKSLEQQDNVFRVAALQKFMRDDGLPEEEAAKKLRLQFPFYYSTIKLRAQEHFQLSAADAKLPYVLKDRVNRAMTSGKVDRAALGRASSMNALVRELIRSGRM